MPNRAQDWFRQAVRDLEHAELSLKQRQFEWACFAAHQSAEKAVKALHLATGQEAWGHVVRKLLEELPSDCPAGLLDGARVLDTYYIPTRYPNGHPEGAPFEHFGKSQAREAIRHADSVLEFCRHKMA